jgi:hypothetical protein
LHRTDIFRAIGGREFAAGLGKSLIRRGIDWRLSAAVNANPIDATSTRNGMVHEMNQGMNRRVPVSFTLGGLPYTHY